MWYLWPRDVGPGPLGCVMHSGLCHARFIFHELTYMCLRVDTQCTFRGTWVDTFANTLLLVHVHEVRHMLATEFKKRGRRKYCSNKKTLEIMGCTILCNYHWKCVLNPVLMAFAGRFPTIGLLKTLRGLHAAAGHVDFVSLSSWWMMLFWWL